MYLLVNAGGKYWRMNYRFVGKQKTLALGVYPDVTLVKARKRRDDARELLADGRDPSSAKREVKQMEVAAAANTFESVALEFLSTMRESWSPKYASKWERGMRKDLFPYIGKLPLKDITLPMLLGVLRKCEKRGVFETANTLRQTSGQVFRCGIQTGRRERSPATDLQGALKPIHTQNMTAILEPRKGGELMRAIYDYQGQTMTRVALCLSALLFQRPGNIRQMEWGWVGQHGQYGAAALGICQRQNECARIPCYGQDPDCQRRLNIDPQWVSFRSAATRTLTAKNSGTLMTYFLALLDSSKKLTAALKSVQMSDKERCDLIELCNFKGGISATRDKGNRLRGDTIYSCSKMGTYLTQHFDGIRPR